MRVTWEPSDIRPGRVVGKSGRGERWIIGYGVCPRKVSEPERKFVLVSLADGMLQLSAPNDPWQFNTAEEIAAQLNQSGEMPSELLP